MRNEDFSIGPYKYRKIDPAHLTLMCSHSSKARKKVLITSRELSRGVRTGEPHPYLVNVWQAAASRITGDTTSWVAWRDVGHLWVQAVSQVKSAEVCGELHVHTYTTYTQMVSMSQHSRHRCSLTPTLTSPNHIMYSQKYTIYGRKMVDALIAKHELQCLLQQ